MPRGQGKNTVCMFPSGALAYYVRVAPSLLFAVKMPGGERKIRIEEPKSEFIESVCNSCPHFMSRLDIDSALSSLRNTNNAEFQVEYGGLATPVVRKLWAQNNGVCGGIDTIKQGECLLNKNWDGKRVISVPVYEHFFTHNPACRTDQAFKMWACKELDNRFLTKYYSFGNVYNDGHICWGRGNKKPVSLKNAYLQYWSAPFNGDLTNRKRTMEETFTKWNPDFVADNWVDETSVYFGEANKVFVRTRHTEGVLISTQAKTLEGLPEEYIHYVNDERTGVAWIRHTPNDAKTWYLNFVRAVPDNEGKRPVYIGRRQAKTASATSKIQWLGTLDDIS